MQPLTGAVSSNVTLSYALLSVSVSLHAAVGEDTSTTLHQVCVHEHAPSRVKQKLYCPVCDNEDRATFAKARAVGDALVVIPEEVQAQVAVKKSTSISLTIHPEREVSSVLLPSGKSYYLSVKAESPDALTQYTVLSRLISDRPDLAFMCKVALRSAVNIFQLVAAGDGVLVLRQMADAALIREHPSIAFSPIEGVNAQLLDVASQMADIETVPFVEADHGTGKTTIIADYAMANVPASAAPLAVVSGGSAMELLTRMRATLDAAGAPTDLASKRKPAARKRAARKQVAS